jgi:hypothetical protein
MTEPQQTPVSVTPAVEETETETLLDKLSSKTTIANIIAAVAVFGGIIYALAKGDVTLVENLAFAGAGYLFGVTSVTTVTESNGKLKAN